VRWALCYLLQNGRRHGTSPRGIVDPEWIDPRSSGPAFDGWKGDVAAGRESGRRVAEAPVAAARTWLLATGRRRHGLIRVDAVPAAAFG